MNDKPVSKLSTVNDVALLTIDNLPNIKVVSDIFNAVAKQKVNVDMISQAPPFKGRINLSFSIPSADVSKALTALNKFKKDAPNLQVEVDPDNTKLTIFGEGMKNLPGVAARLFTILAAAGIVVKLVTTSEVDISYLINYHDVDKAIESIKQEFEL